MPPLPGGCYCAKIRYQITLDDPASQARTSLCHCGNCKRFTGGGFGVTTRVPRSSFSIERGGEDYVRVHEADNGSGVTLRREFCGVCGSGILEFGVGFILCFILSYFYPIPAYPIFSHHILHNYLIPSI